MSARIALPAATPATRRGRSPSALVLGVLSVALLAHPASADTLRGEARVTDVTLYPDGASVTRQVTVLVPEGQHRLVIPGLPEGIDPAALRLTAQGARIAAVSVQTGPALPPDLVDPPAVTTARRQLRAAEQAVRAHDQAVSAILVRAEAADETVAFLRDLARGAGAAEGDIAALAADVQAQMLAAKQTALAARSEAAEAASDREPLVRAVDAARAALDAITAGRGEAVALTVDLTSTGTDAVVIEVTTQDARAGWQPVYDMRLDRQARTLSMDRGVLIAQDTGEDWSGIQLTLSTARPAERAEPSVLDTEFVEIVPDTPDQPATAFERMSADAAEESVAGAPMPAQVTAAPRMQGLTLVFDYPAPVDVRAGVDGLRLALDSVSLTPDIRAEAVPLYDSRATLVAQAVNGTQLLLPGTATLYVDGALVGTAEMAATAPGDRLIFGFGPIDGITVERRLPESETGDSGLITRSLSQSETVQFVVKNLTPQSWPVRIIGRVPVSRQEDLSVRWSADPAPTEVDPDGRRGVLHWDSTLAAGATRQITLTTELRWPAEQRLLR